MEINRYRSFSTASLDSPNGLSTETSTEVILSSLALLEFINQERPLLVPVCLPMARGYSYQRFIAKLLVSASAIAIIASAILKEHPFSIAIASLALIYNVCGSNPGAKTVSISGMFIACLAIAVSHACIIFLY
jgi:hypothetical protein